VGLIRNDALVEALKRLGLVPDSTTSVSIRTTEDSDGYVRMAYHHVDEDGTPTMTTTRLIDGHAHCLDQLDWASLVSDDPTT
jgi:hypothetical protein